VFYTLISTIVVFSNCLENEQVNRLMESLHLFEDVTNSDIFKKASVILFLNKTGTQSVVSLLLQLPMTDSPDLFEKKLKIVPLSKYYPSFQGMPPASVF
jgi:guanine nucleotide-binding protein subunit alpha